MIGLNTKQLILLLIAAGALAGAAIFYPSLDEQAKKHEFVLPGDTTAVSSPLQTLLTLAPGGLRAPIVTFLWIRVEELKEKGRYHEMRDLSDWICRFMPRYPGVWAFHAWNMAWNVSVTAHQEEERWGWVQSGINLLRDRAIPQNPKSLALYKELGWIFLNKMGQDTDDMHRVYKQRWAERMQHLLAPLPYGDTASVIAAFRPVATAPLDRDPYRAREGSFRGNHRRGLSHDGDPKWNGDDSAIQSDMRKVLFERNPAVADYARALAEHGVKIDESLIEAYSRFSLDDAVEVVRRRRPQLKGRDEHTTKTNRAISALINDAARAGARNDALAFVRAQVLWNSYRLDPTWMLHLMERHKAPLDWRSCQAHGLYWFTLGQKVCGQLIGKDDALNIDRNVLNTFKDLTWIGRLTYAENPDHPESPEISWTSDWRFIEPTHQAHIELAKVAITIKDKDRVGGKTFDTSKFRVGHENFISQAIQMLYAGGRRQRAMDYFQWLKREYKVSGGLWELPLEEYVVERLKKEGRPIPITARAQIRAAVVAAYEHYAFGNHQKHRMSLNYAKRVYNLYQSDVADRLKLPPWEKCVAAILAPMMVNPRTVGMYLDIPARHQVYSSLNHQTQLDLYPRIAPLLRRECKRAEPPLDFKKAFPEPPGLAEYIQQQRIRARARGRQLIRPE